MAEVEIMRKLREAYENDVAAINVSVCGSTILLSLMLISSETLAIH